MTNKTDRYDNWECKIVDNMLTITINLDEQQVDAQPSQSGKNITVATTGGPKRIAKSKYRMSLTVYRPLQKG